MRTAVRPVKVKRKYKSNEWRPHFAVLRRMSMSMPGAPKDVNGNPELVRFWVFMEWIETKPRDNDGQRPWVYRLREPT